MSATNCDDGSAQVYSDERGEELKRQLRGKTVRRKKKIKRRRRQQQAFERLLLERLFLSSIVHTAWNSEIVTTLHQD
jgi:hypothetical protein